MFESDRPFHVGDARFSIRILMTDGQEFTYSRTLRLIED